MGRSLTVLATGPRALVQDLGRPGLAHVGVGRSGAADRAAHRLAQRLVGNPEGAAGVEVTLGGFEVRAHGDCLIAVTGASGPVTVEGRPIGHAAVQHVRDGQRISVGAAVHGLRAYLAVRGGVALPPVLGSASTDTLAGLGPAPLAPGAVLPIGDAGRAVPTIEVAPVSVPEEHLRPLLIVPGPRLGWLADPDALTATTWRVSSRSDRMGVRLEGRALARHPSKAGVELLSEGVVRGSLQVPPGGEPVLFLADHPVTGGYPVAAVVVAADVDRAAQARPGQGIRLAWRH